MANTCKDFHFNKVAYRFCDEGDVIAIKQLGLIGLSRRMLGKHMLDVGRGQFPNQILPWVCFKRDKASVQVDARGTS